MNKPAALLRVDQLVKHFPVQKGLFSRQKDVVHAVDGLSFELHAGDTMALVGESGCGKSTVGRLVLRCWRPPPARCGLRAKTSWPCRLSACGRRAGTCK